MPSQEDVECLATSSREDDSNVSPRFLQLRHNNRRRAGIRAGACGCTELSLEMLALHRSAPFSHASFIPDFNKEDASNMLGGGGGGGMSILASATEGSFVKPAFTSNRCLIISSQSLDLRKAVTVLYTEDGHKAAGCVLLAPLQWHGAALEKVQWHVGRPFCRGLEEGQTLIYKNGSHLNLTSVSQFVGHISPKAQGKRLQLTLTNNAYRYL